MVTFIAEFAGNSAVVTAWVSQLLQGMIIFGYQTLMDLGFIGTNLGIGVAAKESYPGVEVEVEDLGRLHGVRAT